MVMHHSILWYFIMVCIVLWCHTIYHGIGWQNFTMVYYGTIQFTMGYYGTTQFTMVYFWYCKKKKKKKIWYCTVYYGMVHMVCIVLWCHTIYHGIGWQNFTMVNYGTIQFTMGYYGMTQFTMVYFWYCKKKKKKKKKKKNLVLYSLLWYGTFYQGIVQVTLEYYSRIYCSILCYGTPYHGMVPRYTMVLYQGIPWSCCKCTFSQGKVIH